MSLDLNPIETMFGPKRAQYVERKNRGGRSNAKGYSYEACFAVKTIASLVTEVIEGRQFTVIKQAPEFVDDFQLIRTANKYKEDYQLKNVQSLRWDQDDNQITAEFRDQQKLNNEHHQYRSKQHLVVPTKILRDKLLHNVPDNIADHSDVIYFADFDSSANKLLQLDAEVRRAIEAACSSPDLDKLEAVFGLLLAAWHEMPEGQNIDVREVIEKARKYNPSFIRVLEDVPPLDPRVSELLLRIPGFQFEINRGFFKWKYFTTDSGQLSYSCLDPKFSNFCSLVLRDGPASFDDLEKLLLS